MHASTFADYLTPSVVAQQYPSVPNDEQVSNHVDVVVMLWQRTGKHAYFPQLSSVGNIKGYTVYLLARVRATLRRFGESMKPSLVVRVQVMMMISVYKCMNGRSIFVKIDASIVTLSTVYPFLSLEMHPPCSPVNDVMT